MKQRTLLPVSLSILALCFCAITPPAGAETSDPIKVEIAVQKEVKAPDKTGVIKVELVEPKRVVPGDEVIYTITYTNTGQEPASSIVVTNHIPEHMTYVRGSARGVNASVLFSADGAEFVARNLVRVRTPKGDLLPAQEQDLTHIRWVVNAEVPPGQAGTVSYRARLQ